MHVVQAGETLWVISARYGVAIDAIVSANGLASASFIRTGQQLVIPGTTTTPAVAGAVTNAQHAARHGRQGHGAGRVTRAPPGGRH